MSQRISLGAMLLESGRITQADVDRTLEYQQRHGGLFGQALVALGILTREEMDWFLATHFELPFIFPDPEAVDREAAHLVTPDWALAHLAVPIVRAADTITVVVSDLLSKAVLDDLSARTGYRIELALASAPRIRELIHALYEPTDTEPTVADAPIGLGEWIGHALERNADRFGISLRGTAGLGWWRARGEVHRALLEEGWQSALGRMIRPSPLEFIKKAADASHVWEATLVRSGVNLQLEAQALVGAGGSELLFRPLQNLPGAAASAELVLPPTLVTELRLLRRSGSARVGVQAHQVETARALLPLLPSLVVGEHVRSIHVNATGEGGSAYALRAEPTDVFAETIATYEMDAITIDLPLTGYPIRGLLRTAPLAFMLLPESDARTARHLGVNWLLTISGEPGSFTWDLHALHG
jgi:type IV pilus assembly protein PilB